MSHFVSRFRALPLLAGGMALLAFFMVAGAANAEERHNMKLSSPYPFAETLSRVRNALLAKGMTVFASIDHQAGAREVGMEMPPSTILIFGNPKSGTPLMQAAPDFALALPLRVLIRADADGRTWLVYERAEALEGRHGLPAAMTERLAPAEKVLAAAIQTP